MIIFCYQGNDNVVLCKNLAGIDESIGHYSNSDKSVPVPFADPNIGIRNQKIGIRQDFLVCSFNRDINLLNDTNYFDLQTPFYLLAAYGPIAPDTKQISRHILTASSPVLINFIGDSNLLISSSAKNAYKVKAHGLNYL